MPKPHDHRGVLAPTSAGEPFALAVSDGALIVSWRRGIVDATPDERAAFLSALARACAEQPPEVVVLTGFGAFDTTLHFEGEHAAQPDVLEVVTTLGAFPVPTVAAISGPCVGAGLELALTCHYRVSDLATVFRMPEIDLGLLPINGAVERLVKALPMADAYDLLATGARWTAERALLTGLIDATSRGDVTQDSLGRVFRSPPQRKQRSADAKQTSEAEILTLRRGLRPATEGSVAQRALLRALEQANQAGFTQGLQETRLLARQCAASDQAAALAYAAACDQRFDGEAIPNSLQQRLLWRLLREAIHLVDAGATPQQVDRALDDFGFTTLPFAMMDRVGLDQFPGEAIGEAAAWRRYSPTLDLLVGAGRLGLSTGRGWYRYAAGDPTPLTDHSLAPIIMESALAQRLPGRRIEDGEVVERCVAAIVNGGAALIDEGAAQSTAWIDHVWNGLGFPRWRGGLFHHADRAGVARILSVLAADMERGSLGPPAASLRAWAEAGIAVSTWPLNGASA